MDFQLKADATPSLLERRSHSASWHSLTLLSENNIASRQHDIIDKWDNTSNGLWLLEQYLAIRTPSTAAIAHGGPRWASDAGDVTDMAPPATEHQYGQDKSTSSSWSSTNEISEDAEKSMNRASTETKTVRPTKPGRKKAGCARTSTGLEQKREKALERNRIAASKCRKRKLQQQNSLQQRESILARINTTLKLDKARVSEELNLLKILVLAHRSCWTAEDSNARWQNSSEQDNKQ